MSANNDIIASGPQDDSADGRDQIPLESTEISGTEASQPTQDNGSSTPAGSTAGQPDAVSSGTKKEAAPTDAVAISSTLSKMPRIELYWKSGIRHVVGESFPELLSHLGKTGVWFANSLSNTFFMLTNLKGRDELLPVDAHDLPAALPLFVQLYKPTGDSEKLYHYLPAADARAITRYARSYLPNVKYRARNIAYGSDAELCGPGYHEKDQLFVSGEPVVPTTGRVKLDELLQDFAFRDPSSKTNLIGCLIGALMPAHVGPLPLMLLAANQAGLGKTLLAEAIAVLFDAEYPMTVGFSSNDAEFDKRLGATLRLDSRVVVVDNAKADRHGGTISSAALERISTVQVMSLRLLGHSKLITRVNDILTVMTANTPRLSPDLNSRSVPVHMQYDSNPAKREFKRNEFLKWVMDNRLAILGEISGMVEMWRDLGTKSSVIAKHRFARWAQVVGGVLEANGFQDFLANLDVVRFEQDEVLSDLGDLLLDLEGIDSGKFKLNELIKLAIERKLLPEQAIANRSLRSNQTRIGTLLKRIGEDWISVEGQTFRVRKVSVGKEPAAYQVECKKTD